MLVYQEPSRIFFSFFGCVYFSYYCPAGGSAHYEYPAAIHVRSFPDSWMSIISSQSICSSLLRLGRLLLLFLELARTVESARSPPNIGNEVEPNARGQPADLDLRMNFRSAFRNDVNSP